ncbi:MAG: M20/M25/M40 family metallo-hydrolase [Christensenellales bacterium]|jgi:carboxypeptidase PM20D1
MSDINQAAERLSQAIIFATVSHQDIKLMDLTIFSAFERFLEKAYPLIHQKLEKTVVNQHGLVFRWPGKESSRRILLTAHYDVVPASDEGWPYPPFSGRIVEGRIYGRGSFDDKGSLIAIMEAVTRLLEAAFLPPCDIYLAFGFDEEVGGAHGAQHIAAYFKAKNLLFDDVLDEGGAVADGAMIGIEKPIAVVGVAEKGHASFRFTFEGAEGHASTPPATTAVGAMARFVSMAEARPAKPRLTDTVKGMLKAIAPHKPGIQGFVLSHPELFAPLIIKTLLKNRQTAAMVRTTVAFTQASGGSSHNVLPKTASCTANIRTLQGDSSEAVLERLRSLGIPFQMETILRDEPTRASALDSAGMHHLKRAIAQVFPDAVITPYLMTGGTDCRHYDQVAQNSYRFLPVRVSEHELTLMHGRGEYLSLENLQAMIAFYTCFIQTLS